MYNKTYWNMILLVIIKQSSLCFRLDEMLPMIIDYPDSKSAFQDLHAALPHTNLRKELISTIKQVYENRILHPGMIAIECHEHESNTSWQTVITDRRILCSCFHYAKKQSCDHLDNVPIVTVKGSLYVIPNIVRPCFFLVEWRCSVNG